MKKLYNPKNCERCSVEFTPNGPFTKFCPTCGPIRAKENQDRALARSYAKIAAKKRAVNRAIVSLQREGKVAYLPARRTDFDILAFDPLTCKYDRLRVDSIGVRTECSGRLAA